MRCPASETSDTLRHRGFRRPRSCAPVRQSQPTSTVGRTLAKLTVGLPNEQYARDFARYRRRAAVPACESFYQLLSRQPSSGTAVLVCRRDGHTVQGSAARNPRRATGVPRPGTSVLFNMPRPAFGADLALQRTDVLVDGRRHNVRLSAHSVARALPTPAPTDDPETDWRLDWDAAITALDSGVLRSAVACFERVVAALPGEAGPKLASAATAELLLDTDNAPNAERLRQSAERYYRTLWRTDHSMVSAAFGLARQLAARDDRAGAIDVLDQVPLTSRHYAEAQLTSVLILLDGRPVDEITEADLRDGARRVGLLAETEPRALQMRARVFGTALDWLRAGATPTTDAILGQSFDQRGLRAGIEGVLRELARHSPRRRHRYTLVDLSNSIRPPSWT